MKLLIITFVFMLLILSAPFSNASFQQFCEFKGELVEQPYYDRDTIKFKMEIREATSVADLQFGMGYGGCEREVGRTVQVCLVQGDYGTSEFRLGGSTTLYRSAMDFLVKGTMQTLVSWDTDNNTP